LAINTVVVFVVIVFVIVNNMINFNT